MTEGVGDLPPCCFDLQNLKTSSQAVLNNVDTDVWTRIEKSLAHDASGPQMFAAMLDHKQQVNTRVVRALMKELDTMSLKSEPRQNIEIFANKVHNLAMRIQGCGNPSDDLPSLVVKSFLDCLYLRFFGEQIVVENIEFANVFIQIDQPKSFRF